jgi:CheY-like chemotaxis protein
MRERLREIQYRTRYAQPWEQDRLGTRLYEIRERFGRKRTGCITGMIKCHNALLPRTINITLIGILSLLRNCYEKHMAKILVIDDEPGILRLAGLALEAAGHAVVAYADGRGAIEHIEREPPDLLITDIFMPAMEGLETIRQARDLRPEMPIIAITGVVFEDGGDYLEVAEKFGAVATLRKPFLPTELVELVSRLLAERNG